MLDDDAKLWAYLSFGYLPAIDTAAPFAMLQNGSSGVHIKECTNEIQTVVNEAAHILTTLTERVVSSTGNSKHVVLLSGGLDSRAILGSLLEVAGRTNIVACTYGYPGNEELEIGTRLAKIAGVEHHRIFIPKTNWTTEELVNSARSRAFPPSFVVGARFQNYRIYKEFGTDCTFWDGLLGGSLTGSRLKHASPFTDWRSALEAFVQYNHISELKLAPTHYDPLVALPPHPLCSPQEIAFDEQLDIAIRQTCYIANRIPAGYTTATPYLDERFWRFFMSLPRSFRQQQRIYKQALSRSFPRLFSMPVAGGRGRIGASLFERKVNSYRRRTLLLAGRSVGHPSFRYANPHLLLGYDMRDNESLRKVISENIADLTHRRLITWMDASRLWSEHLAQAADHTEALRVLVSLEIALKIAEIDQGVSSKT